MNARHRPLLALALGLAAFAAGLALARLWLPEWQAGHLRGRTFFTDRYRDMARRAGVRLPQGAPRLGLAGQDEDLNLPDSVLDRLGPRRSAQLGAGLLVEVLAKGVRAGGASRTRELLVRFLPSGEPVFIRWGKEAEVTVEVMSGEAAPSPAEQAAFTRLLLRSGERLGPAQPNASKPLSSRRPIVDSEPPQEIVVTSLPGGGLRVFRRPAASANGGRSEFPIAEVLLRALPAVAGLFTVLILFFVLLGRRRIDLVNGALLGVVVLVAATLPTLARDPSWSGALEVLGAFFLALWTFLVWSTGESYLRAVQPGFATSLDALSRGRLGPRGARSLVYGVAAGAFLAGLRLAALALAARLPGYWLEGNNVRLPLFGPRTPFNDGALLAGGVALAMGLAWRLLPARWAPWAAAVAAGLAIPFVSAEPIWYPAAMGVIAAGTLVLLCRRAGLAAVLVAALSGSLLQAAGLAASQLSWLPLSFAVGAGAPTALLILGLLGLRRAPQAEFEGIRPPTFMKRLEEERRLRYEMDLLARMQLGLLPAKLPEVEGWEIAVRSLLATEAGGDLYDFIRDEAGRLWIAAGDVAGHGYSCAIVQSMTAAALTSLIDAEKTPAEVLRGIDRVIRRGSQRNFTSLALVRLEPRTGEAAMSNAGHPFPLLLLGAAGAVEEIDLPGLPLGQGPARQYADLPFQIPPGSSLVFCSDGLFEGADWHDAPYGYERPRELLHALGSRSAADILEALFADWRRHLAGREHQDDTTVVVVKRL